MAVVDFYNRKRHKSRRPLMIYFKKNAEYTVPFGYKTMDVWMIGGGAAGFSVGSMPNYSSRPSWSYYLSGTGGSSGCVYTNVTKNGDNTIYNPTNVEGSPKLSITIGSGGNKSDYRYYGGNPTTLSINDTSNTKYIANGGTASYNSTAGIVIIANGMTYWGPEETRKTSSSRYAPTYTIAKKAYSYIDAMGNRHSIYNPAFDFINYDFSPNDRYYDCFRIGGGSLGYYAYGWGTTNRGIWLTHSSGTDAGWLPHMAVDWCNTSTGYTGEDGVQPFFDTSMKYYGGGGGGGACTPGKTTYQGTASQYGIVSVNGGIGGLGNRYEKSGDPNYGMGGNIIVDESTGNCRITATNGIDAKPNSGGGGGGAACCQVGSEGSPTAISTPGSGGSGICIIRLYPNEDRSKNITWNESNTITIE